jgi:DNA polymerase
VSGREADPRSETISLVAAARRWLEREQAAGLGDLLASGLARHHDAPPDEGGPEVLGELASQKASVPLSSVASFENPFDDDLDPGGVDARATIVSVSLPVLDAIAAEARACRICGLCDTRTQAVPGVGSAASGIVFVGEAPGADEDRRGEPFVGRAGELLTRIIKAMDDAHLIPDVPLSRDTVFICNVLKCRPPENRNPLPHEIEGCSPYLRRQLAALRPRIICCLGKFAAELLVGVKGTIGGLRGKTYRYQGAKLIVTYHPAACLRNPAYKRPVWEDMQLLAREYLTDEESPCPTP